MTMYKPPHPGELIQEVYLAPNALSCLELSSKLNVEPSTLNRILKGSSGISPEMALRLSEALGPTPESWLAMQGSHDLWQAKQALDLHDVTRAQFKAA